MAAMLIIGLFAFGFTVFVDPLFIKNKNNLHTISVDENKKTIDAIKWELLCYLGRPDATAKEADELDIYQEVVKLIDENKQLKDELKAIKERCNIS